MALSRLAQQFADEINGHDWSDAPYRVDRAGHSRASDSPRKVSAEQLDPKQTEYVRVNVMWVTAQVLAFNDPNFDVYEYASVCGIGERSVSGGRWGKGIENGLRGRPGDWNEPGK